MTKFADGANKTTQKKNTKDTIDMIINVVGNIPCQVKPWYIFPHILADSLSQIMKYDTSTAPPDALRKKSNRFIELNSNIKWKNP